MCAVLATITDAITSKWTSWSHWGLIRAQCWRVESLFCWSCMCVSLVEYYGAAKWATRLGLFYQVFFCSSCLSVSLVEYYGAAKWATRQSLCYHLSHYGASYFEKKHVMLGMLVMVLNAYCLCWVVWIHVFNIHMPWLNECFYWTFDLLKTSTHVAVLGITF